MLRGNEFYVGGDGKRLFARNTASGSGAHTAQKVVTKVKAQVETSAVPRGTPHERTFATSKQTGHSSPFIR